MADITQAEFNSMLQTAISQGLPGGLIHSQWKWEDVETSLGGIMGSSIPSRTVTVTAAELPAYIKSLPRLLTEHLDVIVERGTVPSSLTLDGFYGPGTLTINGMGSVLNGAITIDMCSAHVYVLRFDVRGISPTSDYAAVHSRFSQNVLLNEITINGTQNSAESNALVGVFCDRCTLTGMLNFQVSNVGTALLASEATVAAAKNWSCSGNQIGAYSHYGGVILLSGNTPDLLGGGSNVKIGGLIVKSNGTLL